MFKLTVALVTLFAIAFVSFSLIVVEVAYQSALTTNIESQTTPDSPQPNATGTPYVSPRFQGPTGAPSIKGPSGPPPDY